MSQEDYWFRHDANALGDDKIEAMLLRYGMAGYGMYWVVVETMRNKDGYHLPRKPYVIAALAKKTMSTPEQIEEFLASCTDEFELFDEDEEGIYSASLLRRMSAWDAKKERLVEAGRKGGEAKAKQGHSDAKAMLKQGHSDATATLKQNVARREEKNREEKSKSVANATHPTFNVPMNQTRYDGLVADFGRATVDDYIERVLDYALSTRKKYACYASAAANWMKRDNVKPPESELRLGGPDWKKGA